MNSVSDNKDLIGIRDLTGLTNTISYSKEFGFSGNDINSIVYFLK